MSGGAAVRLSLALVGTGSECHSGPHFSPVLADGLGLRGSSGFGPLRRCVQRPDSGRVCARHGNGRSASGTGSVSSFYLYLMYYNPILIEILR